MRPSAEVLAPGKLVLIGEYTVLDGAPAAVLAINRGVRCEVLPGSGISTPDGDTRFVAPARAPGRTLRQDDVDAGHAAEAPQFSWRGRGDGVRAIQNHLDAVAAATAQGS